MPQLPEHTIGGSPPSSLFKITVKEREVEGNASLPMTAPSSPPRPMDLLEKWQREDVDERERHQNGGATNDDATTPAAGSSSRGARRIRPGRV